MAKPQYDYDSEDFYNTLQRFASVVEQDDRIAILLDLTPEVFNRMKNGKYEGWDEEKNKRRSERISQVLTRARSATITRVHNTLFQLAIGEAYTYTDSVKMAGVHCECKGKKVNCPKCGGTGWVEKPDSDDAIIQKTRTKLAPSLSALTVYLRHHDPDYRKIERGLDEETSDIPEMPQGVNVIEWLGAEKRDKELLEKQKEEQKNVKQD